MKRITGVLAGVALAGTLGVGTATSASAAQVGASDAKITCPGRVQFRSVWVDCPGSTPGTQFRAVAYCQRPNGATFSAVGPWKNQVWGGRSVANCYYPNRAYNGAFQWR